MWACRSARKLIAAAAYCDITPRERARLDKHLEQCAECRAEAQATQEFVAVVPKTRPELNHDLVPGVRARLVEEGRTSRRTPVAVCCCRCCLRACPLRSDLRRLNSRPPRESHGTCSCDKPLARTAGAGPSPTTDPGARIRCRLPGPCQYPQGPPGRCRRGRGPGRPRRSSLQQVAPLQGSLQGL